MGQTLIVTHVSADFDAAASAYGASLLYEDSRVVLPGSANRNVREFLALHSDVIKFYGEREIDFEKISCVVMTDIQTLDRTGVLYEPLSKLKVKKIIFDHHPMYIKKDEADEIHIEQVGSTTTLIVEEIIKHKKTLSPAEATFLALGIHEDTGSLTFPNTTSRDVKALSYLYEKGARPDIIYRFLHTSFTDAQLELLKNLLENLEIINFRGIKLLFSHAKTAHFIDGASTVVHRLSDIYTSDIVVVVLVQEDKSVIISRSSIPEINCLEMLSSFEVGGHPEAAVSYTTIKDPFQIKGKVIEFLRSRLSEPVKVKDVMTKYVITVAPDMKVSEVKRLFLTTGHSGFPVLEEGKLVGIITRSEIEKAEIHKLNHAPVKGFMIRDLKTISPDEPIEKAVEIFMSEGIGRLPVVDNGKLIGILTRTDILKAMKGEDYYSKEKRKAEEIAMARFEQNLPEEIKSAIRLAGFIAEELNYKAYLVGGIVRDLILGYENLDIDIVVEGSAIDVAERLSKSLNAKIDSYERFNTAVVILPSGLRIDFATARTEYYEKPGALPVVTKSSIKSDLLRRDFTINALAMSLSRKDFGRIVDVTGGLKDLFQGKIRVMHSLSFIEDPTRIIRGVRFEAKFDFKMDNSTEALAREAINMGMIKKAAGVRMRDEIFDLVKEEKFYEGIERLENLGALSELFEDIKLNSESLIMLRNIQKKIAKIDRNLQKLAVLAVILSSLNKEKRIRIYDLYKFNSSDFKVLEQTIELFQEKELNFTKRSEIYFFMKKFDERALQSAYAALNENSPLHQAISLYLNELKNIKPPLNGREIISLGVPESPAVGEIKNDVLSAYLDGIIRTKEEAIDFALKKARVKK